MDLVTWDVPNPKNMDKRIPPRRPLDAAMLMPSMISSQPTGALYSWEMRIFKKSCLVLNFLQNFLALMQILRGFFSIKSWFHEEQRWIYFTIYSELLISKYFLLSHLYSFVAQLNIEESKFFWGGWMDVLFFFSPKLGTVNAVLSNINFS